MSDFSKLASPLTVRGRELRNRIIMSLYPTKMAGDGFASQKLLEWYRARAKGGAAAIVIESIPVDPTQWKGGKALRIEGAEYADSYRSLVAAIQAEGALAIQHLTYSGKMKSPSSDKKGKTVDLLSIEDLRTVITMFGERCSELEALGVDGAEIQASYGGMVQEFLSPLTNKRDDEYGGSLENRRRLLLEIITTCRTCVSDDFILTVKLCVDERTKGGYTAQDSIELSKQLESAGVDLIVVTSGGGKKTKKYTLQPFTVDEGVNVEAAATIKAAVRIPVAAMGKIKRPAHAESVISEGQADAVCMTRALLADPELPNKVIEGRPDDVRGCISCLECANIRWKERSCTVNPWVGRDEQESAIEQAEDAKDVLVIGGGPAGMAFASLAAERGHRVTLHEASTSLGGTMNIGTKAPHKAEVNELARYLGHRVGMSGVDVQLVSRLRENDIRAADQSVLVVATGAMSRRDGIPGADRSLDPRVVLTGTPIGEKVAIIGGGSTGAETAVFLLGKGHQVEMVVKHDDVAAELPYMTHDELIDEIRSLGGTIHFNAQATEIGDSWLTFEAEGITRTLSCDDTVLAIGETSDVGWVETAGLTDQFESVHRIGDASGPGNAMKAIREGSDLALSM